MIDKLIAAIFGPGGAGRVRALLVLSLTGAAIQMFSQGHTPPAEFLTVWSGATAFYFAQRGAANGGGAP